jgi:DNA-binding CsgD family transcriptional regulator
MESEADSVYPPLFRRHARRPRLTRLLDESSAQAIVVTAPAGYGKTTLAAEWLQDRSNVIWYHATSASADVAAFSAGVADVISALMPGVGDRIKQRLRVADTPERAARPLAELLAEDIAGWPEGALLVIDDYHLVADSEPVEDFFDWLLTLSPQLRVLVTSRRRPRWASARRILYGEITEIDRDQLAMNAEEAGRVLDDRSDEAVRALVAQAEGWPALIGLAALTEREIPEERVSEALYRYFAEEVVRGEAPEVERFMLLASVPSTIDARTARDVLRFEEPDETLAWLVSQGLLHAAAGEFRFHPLLRTFLRRKLETEEPVLYRELVDRAIDSARSGERWEDAFDLAIETDRLETAAEILEQATPDLLAAGQSELLSRWLNDCRGLGVEHPGAILARGELLIRQGHSSEAAPLVRNLALQLPSNDPRVSRAWYLAGLASHLMSMEEDALKAHLQALEAAENAYEQSDALWGAYLAAAELGASESSTYLAEMETLSLPDVAFRLRLATGRMGARIAAGSLHNISEIFDPLVPLADHVSDPMVKTSFLARAAETQVIRAHYDSALAFASEALAVAESLHLEFAIGLCLLPRVAAEIGLRKFARARQTLKTLGAIALSRDDPYLEVARQVSHLKLALSDPRHRFVESELPTHLWDSTQVAVRAEYLSLRALSSSARGNVLEAQRLSGEARQLAGGVDSVFNARFADLIAVANGEQDDSFINSAIGLILECSEAEAFDSLVLACRTDPRVGAAGAADATTRLTLRRTLLRSGDDAIARQAGLVSDDFAGMGGSVLEAVLTPRERDVLKLLSLGLSNSAIATQLVITESTVKAHVHHILEKLGVETRLQAVLKAADANRSSD